MRYMLLIYESESQSTRMSGDERAGLYTEYMALTEALKRSGQHVSSGPLQPTATATTVRVKNGRTITTDGPFAETHEQLGGYYLIEANDLNEAAAIAARVPAARTGSVEIRPMMEIAAPR